MGNVFVTYMDVADVVTVFSVALTTTMRWTTLKRIFIVVIDGDKTQVD
jgi:hypothetical protein